MKMRTSYDVLPLSFRLIMMTTDLTIKESLNTLTTNGKDIIAVRPVLIVQGIVSAPLWDSKASAFAGLITATDYINVVQYYWQNPDKLAEIDKFKLNSLPDIEKKIGVTPVETISIHPSRPLFEACRLMLQSRARRIPLIDVDDETKRHMVVSVITQYRILKFIAVNVKETQLLRKPLKELVDVGTRNPKTCTMDTPVIDVIHLLVKCNISSVPIVDKNGVLLNVFESVDVISIIKGGNYEELNLTVGEALLKRSDVSILHILCSY
jgi:5'-AMP-activated protein kinase regulatory gamma subunit